MVRGRFGITPLLAPILLSACIAQPSQPAPASGTALEPRYSTFRCDGGSQITLEDFDTSVHVIDSRGPDIVLPASPPAQRSRYGQPGYALLLEGGKALWMVSGKSPVNCAR